MQKVVEGVREIIQSNRIRMEFRRKKKGKLIVTLIKTFHQQLIWEASHLASSFVITFVSLKHRKKKDG